MHGSTKVRRLARGAMVTSAAVALLMSGATAAGAQDLSADRDRPGTGPAAPNADLTTPAGTPGLAPDRSADAEIGQDALRGALERDLAVSGEELDELLDAAAEAVELDAELQGTLGTAFAGSWFAPESGDLTVAVTTAEAAELATSAGAETTVVSRSERDLTRITDALDSQVEEDPQALAGVYAWRIQPERNQVVVTAAEGQAGSVEELVAEYGDAVSVEETSYEPRPTQQLPFLDGGLPYNNITQGAGCSTGFNVRDGAGTGFFLTAGHCGNAGDQTAYPSPSTPIGPFVDSWFPTFDDALVQVTDSSWIQGPWVWTYPGFVTVNGFTDAPVGTPICASGRTTQLTCGTITGKNETVTYSGGFTVSGLTRHNACVEPGDSGGSNLNVSGGNFAEGVSSGAQLSGGQCLPSPVSWYFPIADSLPYYNAAWGVSLLTG